MPSSLPKKAGGPARSTVRPLGPGISVSKLEDSLLANTSDPNPLLKLVNLARHPDSEVVHKAIWALHRVFIKFIEEGKVGGISRTSLSQQTSTSSEGHQNELEERGDKDMAEAGAVRAWVRARLLEYVETLGGLMRDSEPALRSSAVPLLLSLFPPLSASISPPDQSILHAPYFRIILDLLIFPCPSLRGATPSTSSTSTNTARWEVVEANQVELEDGVLPPDVAQIAHKDFWAMYDDLRWVFFRESARLVRDRTSSLPHQANLLAQLLPLTNLPKVQKDLNAFYVPALSSPPTSKPMTAKKTKVTKSARMAKAAKSKAKADVDALPAWMATYESDMSSDEDDTAIGKKRARPTRTSALSVHAAIHSVASHTTLYSDLWETVLARVPLDEFWMRKVLIGLHGERGILGHMKPERRVRVADWLGSLVDGGGAMAMLAMNGLYVLMTQYNLEYPQFYKRLYGLLDGNAMHVKYRARFFRLLDTFLSSPMLPAAMIASFIKRLSGLSLTAPPAAIIILIPFIYNLFKRHPGCMIVIQRHGDSNEEGESAVAVPYDALDPSPFTSKAIDSSCWELAALQGHYLASVGTMAKVFGEVFTKPEFNMEDFLDHGYGTLFETAVSRKIKYPPALSMDLEVHGEQGLELFPGEGVEEEERAVRDVVSQLWCF